MGGALYFELAAANNQPVQTVSSCVVAVVVPSSSGLYMWRVHAAHACTTPPPLASVVACLSPCSESHTKPCRTARFNFRRTQAQHCVVLCRDVDRHGCCCLNVHEMLVSVS